MRKLLHSWLSWRPRDQRKARDISPWEDLVTRTDDLTELLKAVDVQVGDQEQLHHRHRRLEVEGSKAVTAR